jgi:ubiquinone/menaquinone biosynthesis C-methylase UbiE
MTKSMNVDEHKAWNEAMAKRFNPDVFITQSGFLLRWVAQQRLNAIVRALGDLKGKSVLDVGCGAGNLLEKLNAARRVGIDLSDTLVQRAKEKLRHDPSTEILKGDAEAMPFLPQTFDAAVCSEVIEHVLNPKAVLQEIHRVLKPNGQLVLTFPNEELSNRTKKIIKRLGIKKWIVGRYPMSDNMLDEWHVREISLEDVLQESRSFFTPLHSWKVPYRFLAYYDVILLQAH